MPRIYTIIGAFAVALLLLSSCSKKSLPTSAVVPPPEKKDSVLSELVIKSRDSLVAIKPVAKRKPKESTPKVITVNDKYANKSVDGRYYYDLKGHRYWRNNKDGKYYLFNKSMLSDDAFKTPKK